jgi:hypothetical protein
VLQAKLERFDRVRGNVLNESGLAGIDQRRQTSNRAASALVSFLLISLSKALPDMRSHDGWAF